METDFLESLRKRSESLEDFSNKDRYNLNQKNEVNLHNNTAQRGNHQNPNGYQQRYKKPFSENNNSLKKDDKRTGMSNGAWSIVFTITEIIGDIVKGILIVGGIIAANLADFIMGSIGVSFLINPTIKNYTFINGFGFGSIISMGSSAIQIYMWSLIQKRGISFSDVIKPSNWKKLPKDVIGFLTAAGILWFIDTFLDVSPMFILFTSETYGSMPFLYYSLIVAVLIIVIILCGFAEILTSNMRSMFSGS